MIFSMFCNFFLKVNPANNLLEKRKSSKYMGIKSIGIYSLTYAVGGVNFENWN